MVYKDNASIVEEKCLPENRSNSNKGIRYGYEESYEAYGEERNPEDGSEGTFEILPQESRNVGFKEKEISPLFGQQVLVRTGLIDPSQVPGIQESNMPNESTITAELRVKSCVVGEFPKPLKNRPTHWGGNPKEVWDIKADGTWGEFSYPVSLHFTADPGHPVVPNFGKIKITIEAV